MIALAVRYWYVLAIGALLVALGAQTMRVDREKTRHAAYIAEAERLATAAAEAQRVRELDWQLKFDKAGTDAAKKLTDLQDAVRRAAGSADGLRRAADNAATAAADRCAKPAQRGPSKPGADPARVLADVLGRARARLAVVDAHADRLRIAGATCETAADALVLHARP